MISACRAVRGRHVATMLVVGLAALALAPALANACGACAEDKVAATYDHRLVQGAQARGDVMVFCEVTGSFDERRLVRAARQVSGIRARSVRTSPQPATLSFAVDAAMQSPQAAVEATQRGLPTGTRLTIVQLLKAPNGALAGSARRQLLAGH